MHDCDNDNLFRMNPKKHTVRKNSNQAATHLVFDYAIQNWIVSNFVERFFNGVEESLSQAGLLGFVVGRGLKQLCFRVRVESD
jgi:hypothetical protein